MRKILIGLSLLASAAHAQYVIDMYGDDSNFGTCILHKYQPELLRLERTIVKEEETYGGNIPSRVLKKIKHEQDVLFGRIKKEGNYLYANVEVVMYPREKQRYVTLEVIRRQEAGRMRWVHVHSFQPHAWRPASIQAMITYTQIGSKLMLQNRLNLTQLNCQQYHCTFGFKHPQLKPFRNRFDRFIRQDKQQIIEALSSVDPVNRATAALFIGEFKDAKEIIRLLLPHVQDPDAEVRNNVVRVISEVMRNAQQFEIEVMPFIQLLDSPYESDRNKSLGVLLQALHIPQQKRIITQNGYDVLHRLAQLKQPNNHDLAKAILDQL